MNALNLDVVVPCYQEEAGIDKFHSALVQVMEGLPGVRWMVLYVDDGSSDGTLLRLNALAACDPRVQVYSFSRNFGHQMALSAGLEASTADVVIMMDGDLQHPPELIPVLLARHREGYDIVSAVRESTEGVSRFKTWTSDLFYYVINKLGDTPIEPGAADFCLLSRRAREALVRMPERHRFLRGMIAWLGFPRAFVRFTARPRVAGVSSYTMWRMLGLAMDAVFSFSTRPMRIMLKAGLAFGVIGFLYLCYEVLRYLIVGDAMRGWPSLMALVSVIGGLQLLAITVCGEYIARIFEESKRRPIYVFKQKPCTKRWADLEVLQ